MKTTVNDHPFITRWMTPLLELRSALGPGAVGPDDPVLSGLMSATSTVDATETTQTHGLHALESTWTGRTADTAVPAIRTTRSEIGAVADRGPQFAALLADAQSTSSRAARSVEDIIDDYRRDARTILATAETRSEAEDGVIDRAAQAIREALGVVGVARDEMEGHRSRLREMGPTTMTTPQGFYPTGTGAAGTGQPLPPEVVAQLQLQQYLISAGVQLGTTAIDAGVELGTKIIDRIADVGIKTIDTLGGHADTAIQTAIENLVDPDGAHDRDGETSPTSPAGTRSGPVPPKAFDFGGGPAPSPGQSAQSNPPAAAVIPPLSRNEPPAARPDTAPKPESTSPARPGPAQGGVLIPPAAPPAAGADQERKPKLEGQLGVTVPAAPGPTAVVPTIGEDDDR
ncbi:hypothetical protein [Nocardia donostiensis]|uniref:Uncharacterized protein n=1 Tax=Nocardia donostiensis TaxID=1538463 RepID=A0A1V2TGB2_9NOCA|nr:hypothetical protein [Nocardia donostiensis]ONM48524.1 hypothetical protein B0T46_12605 [Nocardia donostiensis]OQS16091.1 hypothetical protein B0T36_04600 [Nocardia donostiensis]OQS19349.1 hypothetical protein B0T44_15155 [Nocardia donostiensis]